jgi:CHAT domain-containing protein
VGPLLRVPFAALLADGARVLDRFDVAYAPSVTGLAALASTPGDPAALASTPGDPTATAPSAPPAAAAATAPSAPPAAAPAIVLADARRDLRHAAEEMRMVVDHTGARPRSGSEATRAALRDAAGAALLHVAGHSSVGSAGGYLMLADGEVTAADIIAWRVRPRIVVLPTCASAATVRREMWGSLAAAFLAAGTRDVVATLFSVEDALALEFARSFYQHGGATDPVAATARAQRELAARHPVSSWSAFVVAGL